MVLLHKPIHAGRDRPVRRNTRSSVANTRPSSLALAARPIARGLLEGWPPVSCFVGQTSATAPDAGRTTASHKQVRPVLACPPGSCPCARRFVRRSREARKGERIHRSRPRLVQAEGT